MGIITRMRRQWAVYWPSLKTDRHGNNQIGQPQAVKVRWVDTNEIFKNAVGEESVSRSVVYLPALADGSDPKPTDYLWLSNAKDPDTALENAPNDPRTADKAFEIQAFSKIPNLKAKESLRIAYL